MYEEILLRAQKIQSIRCLTAVLGESSDLIQQNKIPMEREMQVEENFNSKKRKQTTPVMNIEFSEGETQIYYEKGREVAPQIQS